MTLSATNPVLPIEPSATERKGAMRVLIVGAGEEQTPIIVRARERGMHVIAVDGNPNAPGLRHAHATHIVSTRDEQGILAVARSEHIEAITSMITETPLRAIRYVADALNLPAPSERSVAVSTDKTAMREAFAIAGLPNPPFALCRSADEADTTARRIGLPVIVKPTDSGGQRGLALCTTHREVAPAFERAQAASSDRNVIIEGFLTGPEVNVVAVVLDGRLAAMTVSDRIKHDHGAFGVVRRHVYPSVAAGTNTEPLRNLVERSANAMDLRDGIIFPQLIITPNGPVFLETGARIPGGTMNELFRTATGIDLIDLQLDLSAGTRRAIDAYRRDNGHTSVVVRFLTADPGELSSGPVALIEGEAEAAKVRGILDLRHFAGTRDRDHVYPLRTGSDRYYYLLAGAENAEAALTSCELALGHLDFRDADGGSRKVGAP